MRPIYTQAYGSCFGWESFSFKDWLLKIDCWRSHSGWTVGQCLPELPWEWPPCSQCPHKWELLQIFFANNNDEKNIFCSQCPHKWEFLQKIANNVHTSENFYKYWRRGDTSKNLQIMMKKTFLQRLPVWTSLYHPWLIQRQLVRIHCTAFCLQPFIWKTENSRKNIEMYGIALCPFIWKKNRKEKNIQTHGIVPVSCVLLSEKKQKKKHSDVWNYACVLCPFIWKTEKRKTFRCMERCLWLCPVSFYMKNKK